MFSIDLFKRVSSQN